MNQKELNEIRRRFRLDKNNFSRIFGCYVNSNREVISWIDASLGLMRQEEQEMYLGLLKKTLSGTLGRNLIDIEFSTAQVADSDEHRLLQTLRQTECKDANARETLCRKIIESLSMGETNYLILLAADAYDVPYRGKDDELQADRSWTDREHKKGTTFVVPLLLYFASCGFSIRYLPQTERRKDKSL